MAFRRSGVRIPSGPQPQHMVVYCGILSGNEAEREAALRAAPPGTGISALRHDDPALVGKARQRVTKLEAIAAWPGHEGSHMPRGWRTRRELIAPVPHGHLVPCRIE